MYEYWEVDKYIHHYNTYKPGSKLIEVFSTLFFNSFNYMYYMMLKLNLLYLLFIILIKYVSTNTYK